MRPLLVLALSIVLGSSEFGASAAVRANVQAFTGARVIDGGGQVIDNAVIIVRDGRLDGIGPAGSVRPPADATRVDVSGKYIIPGLISTHVHISDAQGSKPRAYTSENTLRQLGLFARYGVTTVWSLGGEQQPAFDARAAQDTSTLDRARLYLAGDATL